MLTRLRASRLSHALPRPPHLVVTSPSSRSTHTSRDSQTYVHITVEETEMAPSPQQPHELVVEGDKVLERTESGTILAEKVRSPRPCSESVQTCLQVLQKPAALCADEGPFELTLRLLCPQDYDHVVRGYKAASHNKRFSHDTREVH